MDGKQKSNNRCENCEIRQDLMSIFDNLTPSLKNQLLTQARIIETTLDMVLKDNEQKKKKKKS